MRTCRQVTTPTRRRGGQGARWIALAVVSVLASSCSTVSLDSADTTTSTPTTAPETTTTAPDPDGTPPGVPATPPAPADLPPPTAPGRLAVIDGRNLVLMDSDGTNRVEVSAENTIASQPSWSPDGQRLAWVELSADGPFLITARADGTERRARPAGFGPFYTSWSPDSVRVATLGGAVDIAFLTVGAEPDFLTSADQAEGYFFSWATDSQSVFAHAESELRRTDADGTEVLGTADAAFGAPVVLPDGRILYADATLNGPSLLYVTDPEGPAEFQLPLASFEGQISLILDDSGTRLAAIVTGGGGGAGFSPVSFQPTTTDQTGTRTPFGVPVLEEGVTVLGLDDLVVTEDDVLFFDEEPAQAAAFDADSSHLAILASDGQGGGYWKMVEFGVGIELTPIFRPSLLYTTSVLPFYDQYATSTTPWSPDGSALAYATAAEGESSPSIWVQSVDVGMPPYRIGEGAYVVWQPVAG